MIDTEEILRLAHLSRLQCGHEELPKVQKKLSAVLTMVHSIQQVDTSNIEPLDNPLEIALPLRTDEVVADNLYQQVLVDAPETRDDFFIVPRFVE